MDKRKGSRSLPRVEGVREKNGKCQIHFYDAEGSRVFESLDIPYTAAGIKQAQRVRGERINFYKFGIGDEPESDAALYTFRWYAQTYLDSAEITRSSRQSYKDILNRYWTPQIGHLPISAITYSKLRAVNKLITWPGTKTRKNAMAPLINVFDLAMADDAIKTNPARQFKRIKHQRPDVDPFTREERDAILGELKGNALVFFTMQFYTGMRPGETIALLWSDYVGEEISVSKEVVRSQGHDHTKTHRVRKVQALKPVRDVLRGHTTRFKKGHILLNQYGEPYLRSEKMNVPFRDALKKLGIRYRRPYNTRHTYASLGLKTGAKPGYLATQLGHSVATFFKHYATWIREADDKSEHSKLEAFL